MNKDDGKGFKQKYAIMVVLILCVKRQHKPFKIAVVLFGL
jgi:hypothetical protein